MVVLQISNGIFDIRAAKKFFEDCKALLSVRVIFQNLLTVYKLDYKMVFPAVNTKGLLHFIR